MVKKAAVPCVLIGLSAVAIALAVRTSALLDDAFISFIYAKNWIGGRGITYNGIVVQGYTNPLWVLLLSGLGWLGVDIPQAARWLGGAGGAGAIIATYWLGRQFRLPVAVALIPAAVLTLSADFVFYVGSGLETVLFAALLTTAVACLCAPQPTIEYALGGGAAAGLLALCRPEGLAVIVAGALYLGVRRAPRLAGLFLAAGVLVIAPWFLWAHSFYGDWLPNSFYAKTAAFSLSQVGWGLLYLRSGLHGYGIAAAGGLVAMVAVAAVRPLYPRARALLLIAALWLIYIVVVGGDFMPGFRLFIPVSGVVLVGAIAAGWSARSPWRFPLAGVAAVSIALSLANWNDPVRREVAALTRRTNVSDMTIGLWLRNRLAPGTLVALRGAGMVPYYSELPTLDTLGINDRHIARFGHRDPNLPIGHQLGDGAYVLSCAPDYVFVQSKPVCGFICVSDRELISSPEFRRRYRRCAATLPGVGPLQYFRRIDTDARKRRGWAAPVATPVAGRGGAVDH
jgi:arabinofuranosyltransferase